jgi:pSer/pThr/pTyr-binding forkhead associated (FHA) protein
MRTWIIGSAGDCDVVVAQPRVSGRHCRFTELADGYLVEDLHSSNGTYVNGERIAEPTRISANDRVTLGALVAMPWPPSSGVPGAMVLRIGRAADSEIVLDDARVSSHHARLLVWEARTLIEDAGSSNGTFVNSTENRATQGIPLTDGDIVYFGSLAVPASQLLAPRIVPAEAAPVPPPIPEWLVEREPVAEQPPPVPAPITPWTILVLAQAPILAILILLVFGRQAARPISPANWPTIAEGLASTTFALAISAVWLGGSLAVWASMTGGSSSGREASLEARLLGSPSRRFAALGILCAIQCAVLLAVVHWGSGLSGPWLPMFGVLLLTSTVGLALGLLLFSLIRAPMGAVAVLMAAFVAMMVLGGKFGSLAASRPGAWIAAAMPSRWAFEGLLLLESERRADPTPPDEAGSDRAGDLAEDYFPADSARMGPKADAMALGFIAIGLAAAAGFISSGSPPRR